MGRGRADGPRGRGLYQVCVTYLAGTPIQNVEFKFKKDDCTTWESVANRTLVINNDSPATQTIQHLGQRPGVCAPVDAPRTTWGS